MRAHSIIAVTALLGLGGCSSPEELRKMYNTPPPANHATPAVRKAVAAMAISVSKYPAEAILLAAKDPKFSVFHVETPKIGEGARTNYCIKAGLEPMAFGKKLDLPIMEKLVANVRIMDAPNGKFNLLASRDACFKEPTEPFPELLEVARTASEAAKRRAASPAVVEDTR